MSSAKSWICRSCLATWTKVSKKSWLTLCKRRLWRSMRRLLWKATWVTVFMLSGQARLHAPRFSSKAKTQLSWKHTSPERLLESLPFFTTHLVLPQSQRLRSASCGSWTAKHLTTSLRDPRHASAKCTSHLWMKSTFLVLWNLTSALSLSMLVNSLLSKPVRWSSRKVIPAMTCAWYKKAKLTRLKL